jgi:hypothetical protein
MVVEPHSQPPEKRQPLDEVKTAHFAYLATHGPITPLNYQDVINSPQAKEWKQAMKKEFDLLV